MSEQSPLVHVNVHHKCFRKLKYRLICIKSRAAILVLLLDLLFQAYKRYTVYFVVVLSGLLSLHEGAIYLLAEIFFVIPFLFYPVGGLIADVRIGRYRMIVISGYICLLVCLLAVIGYLLHWYIYDELYVSVIVTMLIIIACLFVSGSAGFQSNMLPFNIDQMMGASGDQLSAVIQWHMFGTFIVLSIPTPPVKSFPNLYFSLTSLTISSVTITLIVVSHYLFKHWLDTTPQITNPFKLIFRVINYSRKNKYPRNRSALTYWEEDYPSRLDLGKEKYGGPFSDEEVEDVKTLLRSLPLFTCLVGFPIAWGAYNLPIGLLNLGNSHLSKFLELYINEDRIPYLVCSLLIVFYQFVIYPCFYKYIPSMLKRIGLGLGFALFSILFITIVAVWFGNFSDPSFECPSNRSDISIVVSLNYKWILIPHISFGCSLFLVVVTTLEFTIAQSPRQMRGLMVGLCYATYGTGTLVSTSLSFVLVHFKSYSRGCIFYYSIGIFLYVIITLIFFLVFAKRYKLRVRDNIIPVHQIAEEHYERYFNQSEEYRREYGL